MQKNILQTLTLAVSLFLFHTPASAMGGADDQYAAELRMADRPCTITFTYPNHVGVRIVHGASSAEETLDCRDCLDHQQEMRQEQRKQTTDAEPARLRAELWRAQLVDAQGQTQK